MHDRGNRDARGAGTARWLLTLLAVLGLVVGTAAPVSAASIPPVAAATAAPTGLPGGPAKTSLAGFNAGNIISDAVFTNKSTMTESQIQAFFNSKVTTCRGGSDKYGPIICLKDFKITSVTMPSDSYCKGYTGAKNESAARIIHRVAQSCGINPQVLIVMLQKEQGLITHTWPSAWRYDIALGQGCPDTAPCDPKFVGFFHQIYGAARQMQIYMEGRHFTWYAPGKTWNILYHPNKSCGTAPVKVANKATSALYYYTPYQPNAAAMKAGYGTGDSCSSYGNRNFYNYFTDWFGSTQVPAINPLQEVGEVYTSLGGLSGPLGAVASSPSCGATTARCTVTYASGIITWTKALGPLAVYGPVYEQYVKQGGLGGKLGYPKTSPTAVTDPNGNGTAQQFDKGWIHHSAAGAFASTNKTMAAYSAAGWVRGKLSWPVGHEVCTSASCVQDFEGGFIGSRTGLAAISVVGTGVNDVNSVYTAQGSSGGPLGAITGSLTLVQDTNGNGLARSYENGFVHGSASGTFSSSSAIMSAYSAAGWLRGYLGWPTGVESKVSDPNGNGVAQEFEGGWVHSSSYGSFSSSDRVMAAYSAAGWVRGALGWPVSNALCTGSSCTQAFTGGIVAYSGSAKATSAVGVSAAAITKVNATASLGKARTTATIVADLNGGGLAQQFTDGWIHSSAAGTFASSNTVMTAYSKAGWVRGKLGWPTSAEQCSGTYCSQSFKGGSIAYVKGKSAIPLFGVAADAVDAAYAAQGGTSGAIGSPAAPIGVVSDPNGNGLVRTYTKGFIHASASGTFSSSSAIMSAYSAAGWLRGYLGWPTGVESKVSDPNGNGVAQEFEGGWVHSSSYGSFSSSDRVMAAYSAAGWVRGALGWPVSNALCTGSSCTQAFTGGIVAYSGSAKATSAVGVSAAAITKVNATASLGKARTTATIVADLNGGGLAQQFTDGWIHSSAAGTFASSNTVMTAYSKAGWVRGKLGWPTSAEQCSSSSCTQQFAGGAISYVKGKAATVTYR